MQFDGIHVVSGSLDTSIRVWDVETGNCIHTLTGHQSLTSGMELKDNILVSGNADSTVKIWDIKTGQCLQTLQGMLTKFSSLDQYTRDIAQSLKYILLFYYVYLLKATFLASLQPSSVMLTYPLLFQDLCCAASCVPHSCSSVCQY